MLAFNLAKTEKKKKKWLLIIQWLYRYGGKCDQRDNSKVQSCSGSFSYWIVATYHLLVWSDLGVGSQLQVRVVTVNELATLPSTWSEWESIFRGWEAKHLNTKHPRSYSISLPMTKFIVPSLQFHKFYDAVTPGTTLISCASPAFQVCV